MRASIIILSLCVAFTLQQVCPTGQFYIKDSNRCADSCPDNLFLIAYNSYCVSTCPFNHLTVEGKKECVTKCPSTHFTIRSGTGTHGCVIQCPSNLYSIDYNRGCYSTIPYNHLEIQTTRKLVTRCPNEFYTNDIGRKCCFENECPIYFIKYNKRCYNTIPFNHLNIEGTKELTTTCPQGYTASKQTSKCLLNK